MSKIFKGLNLSGDDDSWFDLMHFHVEDIIEDNGINSKLEALKVLVDAYEDFAKKLKEYPKPFQLWIEVREGDLLEDDSIYLHTENPNRNNFPITLLNENTGIEITNHELHEYIMDLDFEVLYNYSFSWDMSDKRVHYFLYKEHIGAPVSGSIKTKNE